MSAKAIDLGSSKAVMGVFTVPENEHIAASVEIVQNKLNEPATDVAVYWEKD